MREGLGWARAGRVTGNWQLEHGSGYSSLFIYMACAVHLCVRVSTLLRSPCPMPLPTPSSCCHRHPLSTLCRKRCFVAQKTQTSLQKIAQSIENRIAQHVTASTQPPKPNHAPHHAGFMKQEARCLCCAVQCCVGAALLCFCSPGTATNKRLKCVTYKRRTVATNVSICGKKPAAT